MKRIMNEVLGNNGTGDNSEEMIFNHSEYALTFDCEKIEFEVTSGHSYQGTFHITTDEKGKPAGYVYSTDIRMYIRTQEFGGLTREISYVYDATGLKEGATVKGVIHIVSNIGECELPYVVRVTSTILECQLGEIRNLFHYANLAMTDWQEAVDLFYSDSFEQILTGNDREYLDYYRGLSRTLPDENGDYVIGNENNVDRFLEISKKKTRVSFSTSVKSIEIKDPEETVLKEIPIKREGWGFTYLKVETEGDCVICETESILADSFEDDIFLLPVYINYSALYKGVNHGKIILSNFFQKIEITVKVSLGAVSQKERNQAGSQLRHDRVSLMSLFISYRIGKLSKAEWAKSSSVLISKMLSADPESVENRLYHAHLLNVQKRENESMNELQLIRAVMAEDEKSVFLGYSYYIEYLNIKDESRKQELAGLTEFLYVQNKSDFRLAWLLLYMKEELIYDDHERWKAVKYQFEQGCNSPLLFIEAIGVMLRTPSVMLELGDFEMGLLTFAIRHDILTGEMRNRFVYLVSREITYSEEILSMLIYCYEKGPDNECLTEICQMLMRGNRIGTDCFKWYEKAVDSEIRINRLYEYYIMSIDLGYQGRLPKLVLMYFAYRSNLDYERNAFLYANVLRHKPAYNEIYEDYLPAIENFAREQIKLHRLNDDLAFIYKTVIGDRLREEPFVSDYAKLLFMYRITVENPALDSVIVVDSRLNEERRFPVYNGEAVITLMDEKQCILLEDEYGNRYADRSYYQVRRIIKTEYRIEEVMENAGLTLLPALFLAEKASEAAGINDRNEAALLYISECLDVTESYRLEIMMKLAEHYFDADDIAKLDELLLKFDPLVLDTEQREKSIRIMVARGMYDRALEWVETYGTDYIDDRVLVRLCDRVLVRSDYEYDPDILKICEGIFTRGRYDETILTYLLLYKQGVTKSLKTLWRATDSFNLDAHGLLENMIVQILYSGETIGEEGNIFLEYVNGGANSILESRFLDLLSYRYFVKEEKIEETVFDRCIYLHQMGENLSDYAKLAFLKRCQTLNQKSQLDEEKKALIVLFIKEFTMRHMLLPFFLEYKNLWSKLAFYDDRCFIEYRGSENSRVQLHYVIEQGQDISEEYRKQEMNHIIGGIYVQSFILFYGERIRYYITEEGSRSEKLTRASVLELTDNDKGDKERKFCVINNLAISYELKDDVTFMKLAEEYADKVYLVDQLFKEI